ncbi:hypothetical protein [Desulfoluna butyratoxydans]|uniref:Uncharacterized protein n=1 Tax=Desulfoluna butyratoxydans TaxID=231438 RepID=A0A4U8YNV2_9BACT|nr:hypothetical protein [Desulfoluna butyratoxydans]VFQ45117.1 hypothetical protein MSL71_27740 [Desulfoluna butyratoxydans]
MSTPRGVTPDAFDSPADSLSCLIPRPADTPPDRFPFWKAVASRDGTRLAIPIRTEPEECCLYTLSIDKTEPDISEPFVSITDLRPMGNRDFAYLCQGDEGWTAVAASTPWQLTAEIAWNLSVTDQDTTACETQDQRRYTPVVDDTPWPESYENTFSLTLAETGSRSAAVVQTAPIAEGDLNTFLSGCFTLATDQGAWTGRYVGAFNPVLSADGALSAVDVRLNQYDYTICVNDQCWGETWPSVWAPVVHPEGTMVWAPVKSPEGWILACDGEQAWPETYFQLWEVALSPAGDRIAAVIAPDFGKWAVVLDGTPWKTKVDGYLAKPVFSPCGTRLGCCGHHRGKAVILVDDHPMGNGFDTAWDPIFSHHGNHVAAKVKRGEVYSVLLDGMEVKRPYIWMAPPAFTPDSKHLMICGIEKQGPDYRYTREFIALT